MTKARSNATANAAKGDLTVGNGTNLSGVLAVGSNGDTIVADSSTATGLKWAIPATTLIKRASFSSVANTGTTFDGVFSSTYKSYQIVIESFSAATNTDAVHFQFRYAGPTTEATAYYGNHLATLFSSSTTVNQPQSNASVAYINDRSGTASGFGSGNIFVTGVGVLTGCAQVISHYIESANAASGQSFIIVQSNITRTGFC